MGHKKRYGSEAWYVALRREQQRELERLQTKKKKEIEASTEKE